MGPLMGKQLYQGLFIQGSTQELTKIASLCKMGRKKAHVPFHLKIGTEVHNQTT